MIATAPTQANRPMTVTTPLAKDTLLLASLKGQEGLSQLFHFDLELLALNGREVPFDRILGQPMTVNLDLPGGKKRYFSGIVSRFAEGHRDHDFTVYRAEVVPAFWLLTRRSQCRIFQRKSVPEILATVLEGLDVKFELQGAFQPRDYCVQYRETDFNFASRLMEEEGIYYFFKHNASGHQMVLANTPQSHPEVPGKSEVIFDPSENMLDSDRVQRWEKTQEIRPGKCTLRDHHFELPHKNLEAKKTLQQTVQVGKVVHNLTLGLNGHLEVYDWPGSYAQRFGGVDRGGSDRSADLQNIFQDNQRTVDIRMQQEAVPGLVVRGAGQCRRLISGHRFSLDRHFNANGPYVLTSVEHTARNVSYRSGDDAPFKYENTFTCIPFSLPYRPARSSPKAKVEGTQTAVVVGPPGDKVFTDKYGRVKVQFHWDRQGKYDADSSCWVRVGTIWAGKRRGVIHIPMVGDEVIVDFLEGDPDRPIIVGSVFNAESMPPWELPENKSVSGYKGDTGSNFLRVENKAGAEQYHLNAEKNWLMTIVNDAHETVGGNSLREVTGEEKVTAKKIILEADEIILNGKNLVSIMGGTVRINC